jgi:hypothetical protein
MVISRSQLLEKVFFYIKRGEALLRGDSAAVQQQQ